MGYALLFAGQGLQNSQMLAWVDRDGAPVPALDESLGTDWRNRMADAGWSARNAIAQPLLTGLALAAWQQLASQRRVTGGFAVDLDGDFLGRFDGDVFALRVEHALGRDRHP